MIGLHTWCVATDGPERARAESVVPGWTYDGAGRLTFVEGSGIPDPPLVTALCASAYSSLVGVLVSGAIVLAIGIWWDNPDVGVAALGAYGMPRVRRGYRLRAALAFAVTTAGCLVTGVVVDRWLPAPWDFFVPLALALAIGSLAGTAATYARWRPDGRNG